MKSEKCFFSLFIFHSSLLIPRWRDSHTRLQVFSDFNSCLSYPQRPTKQRNTRVGRAGNKLGIIGHELQACASGGS
ncbi:hypothetical protein [Capnocytophaga gingivalis]|uniref:Secreted protein n=1 Tax=Capnocytophaga gingivalis TaxID=1017 RepID=A0ABU5Z9A5_9FLAO|nr:hypothetical protein [Capnocytophaga gingivalis]MEB3075283.1 hypothetical protein [Capnocytophaga gingivalis]